MESLKIPQAHAQWSCYTPAEEMSSSQIGQSSKFSVLWWGKRYVWSPVTGHLFCHVIQASNVGQSFGEIAV